MNYLLVPVFIQQTLHTGDVVEISSLVFTNTLNKQKAKKLCAFHIYHLHENRPENLPTLQSVKLQKKGVVRVDQHTTIRFGKVSAISVEQKQIIGRLGLFGYNKKLVHVRKSLLLC